MTKINHNLLERIFPGLTLVIHVFALSSDWLLELFAWSNFFGPVLVLRHSIDRRGKQYIRHVVPGEAVIIAIVPLKWIEGNNRRQGLQSLPGRCPVSWNSSWPIFTGAKCQDLSGPKTILFWHPFQD